MIVLAETNFTLEIAFRRDEVDHAKKLLEHAERKDGRLAIPACSIPESLRVLTENKKRHAKLAEDVRRELARSSHFSDLDKTSIGFSQTIIASADSEGYGLEDTIKVLAACATIIPLEVDAVREITRIQAEYGLQSEDACVLATIMTWLHLQPKEERIFVSKDRDFSTASISTCLNELECRLFGKFSAASSHIKNQLLSQ
jgi:predicted nucleic acid-binding protein